jgi:defect in organelle trafficking protein DotA
MKKWLWPALVLLTLFCGAAFADSSNPVIASTAVANKTDLSIAYLSSVFGTVSGVLTGTSGQMLGKLMLQFNQGMLVLAGCWLAYSILSIVLKTGLTGSFMSQEYKVPMVVLRIGLGFGLLIPNPSTGYTVLQGIVMQVTVQGVKLADQVWEYGLDYMNAGGALWSRPVQVRSDGAGSTKAIMSDSDMTAILGNTDALATTIDSNNFSKFSMVQKIMAMEACMVRSSIEIEQTNSSNSSDDSGVSSPDSSMPISIYEDTVNNRFEFPAGVSAGSADNQRSTGCGIIRWNSLVNEPNMNCQQPTDGTSSDNTDCGFSHLAVREAIYSLLPAVKKYVCLAAQGDSNSDSAVCSGVDSTDSDPSYMSDALMSATLSYKNLIDPVVRSHVDASGTPNPLNFVTQAKKDGWMMAGRYYWDMLRVEDAYDLAVSTRAEYRSYIPDDGSYTIPGDSSAAGPRPSADNLGKVSLLITATTGSSGYIAQTTDLINQYTGAAKAGNAQTEMSGRGMLALKQALLRIQAAFGPIGFVVGPIISDFVELIATFSSYSSPVGLGAEPILWLHKLGLTCISLGFNIWLGIGLALIPTVAALGICPAVNPMQGAIRSFLEWTQPFILGGAAGLIVVGFSLGFYMPLHPFMLFLFGGIGWIIAVIEALVAAPLVALGITHPDGHDFLGKSTHAVMLLVGLFLRPVLMLIGLFASMILCQVSLSLVLYSFSGFVADLFYFIQPINTPIAGDPVLAAAGKNMFNVLAESRGSGLGALVTMLLVFPLLLGVFTMVVYTATVTCFSLIHHLPDYVMSWIGGPQSHVPNAQGMVDQVKQSMSGMAGKLAEGVSHSKPPKKPKDPRLDVDHA